MSQVIPVLRVTSTLIAAGPGRQVGRPDHHDEAGRGGGQGLDRPAAGPGHRQAEQGVLHLEAGRHADQQAGQSRAADLGPRAAFPLGADPERHDPQQPERRGQPVDVAAGHDLPQQQRVHRPQQVRPDPHLGIGAEQAVQGQDHRAEGDRFLQLEPERDAGQRGPAEFGRTPFGRGGHRPVHRDRVHPAGRDLAGRNLLADRVAGLLQLPRGHHVGAVPGHRDAAAGGVRDGIRRARRAGVR